MKFLNKYLADHYVKWGAGFKDNIDYDANILQR